MSDEDEASQPEDAERKRRELTPEEREALRNVGDVAKLKLPKINVGLPDSVLKNISGALGMVDKNKKLLEAISPALKMSNLGIKGLDTRGLLGANGSLSALASTHSKLLDSMGPALRASDLIGRQSGIASALGQLGVAQSAWTSQVMKNVDFGVSKQMAAMAKQFTASQSLVWESVAASAREMVRSFYPTNLRDIDGITLTAIKAVAFDEGIPLFLVPRQETAELLLAADSLDARLALLEERSGLILEDCRTVLSGCASEQMAGYVAKVGEAAAAHEAGFPSAAQALISSIVESLVWDYFGHEKKRFLPNKWNKTTPGAYDEMGAHEFLAFAPIWQAFQQYELSKGDPLPATFSRHATAHTVSEAQYKPVNALQGLMLVTGLVAFMDAATEVGKAA